MPGLSWEFGAHVLLGAEHLRLTALDQLVADSPVKDSTRS